MSKRSAVWGLVIVLLGFYSGEIAVRAGEIDPPPPVCCNSGGPCQPGEACCQLKNTAPCSEQALYYCTSTPSQCFK
jgi:hypothetical protein